MMWKRVFGIGLLAGLLAPVAPAGSIIGEGVDPKIISRPVRGQMSVRLSGRARTAHEASSTGSTPVQQVPPIAEFTWENLGWEDLGILWSHIWTSSSDR